MDGNGRWAAQRHLPRVEGHRAGIESVRDVVEGLGAARHRGADALRVLGRELEAAGDRSVDADDAAQALPPPRAEHAAPEQHPVPRDRPRRGAGARHPPRAGARPRRRPPRNTGMLFNIALNYGGRAEIVEAVEAAARRRRVAPTSSTSSASPGSSTPRVSPIPICSSAPAARCGSATSCSGRSRTRRSGSPKRCGRISASCDLLEAVLAYQKRDRRYGGINQPAVAGR